VLFGAGISLGAKHPTHGTADNTVLQRQVTNRISVQGSFGGGKAMLPDDSHIDTSSLISSTLQPLLNDQKIKG